MRRAVFVPGHGVDAIGAAATAVDEAGRRLGALTTGSIEMSEEIE
jgi:hypothetical protein